MLPTGIRMIADQPDLFGQQIIVRHDDAAFAAMNVFMIIQRIYADIAQCSGKLAAERGSRRLRRIFNHQ